MIKLYDYFFSGAAYRTRIALNLKGLEYEQEAVHLTKDGGEQFQAEYDGINPQNLVPTLIDNERTFFQSMAIMEYLEEAYAEPALLPRDQVGRARVRALANIVACDTHPLNNLRVRLFLGNEMGLSEENQKNGSNDGFTWDWRPTRKSYKMGRMDHLVTVVSRGSRTHVWCPRLRMLSGIKWISRLFRPC